jgi:DNA mismatch repair protein MutS2
MTNKTLEYIDYLKLLRHIENYASTGFITELISELRPLSTIKEIEERQERIGSILKIIQWDGPIPLTDMPDVRRGLQLLTLENYELEAPDFLPIAGFLTACASVVAFLRRSLNKDDYIDYLIGSINPLNAVSAKIRKTINEEGYIEDSASYELSKIRSDLYQLKDRARKSLERIMDREEVRPVLQDSYIAIRNGRYVIPLKPNYNQYFKGIVHDYSHSLKTSFVEPIETMETNNTISILEKEEKEEEKRILRELTSWTRTHLPDMEVSLDRIAELDFHHTLALFAMKFNCIQPKVETDGSIEILGAMNPFIVQSKGERTVPIDIVLDKGKKAMIISGPNADGKTVAMKTTGLLLAMAASGFYIPARQTPHIHLFPSIYAVMGDEQDIAMELSTFTAHVEAIKNVYEQSSGGELVLIDEIGGGTEPQEASALAMALIDAFVEKGCTIIVTTHLNLLKAYGSSHDFAINVATDFDPKGMKPLYRLIYGMAGLSNALKVAENSGMPAAIIEKSYSYLGKQEFILNDLIKGLEKEKKEAEEEKRKAQAYREDARKRLEALKEKRDEYLKGVEESCKNKVIDLEAELEEIRKEVAKKDREATRAAREKIKAVRRRFVPESKVTQLTEIRVGDYVRVRTIGKEGYVMGIDEQKRIIEVAVGNMHMRINKDYVEKAEKGAETRKEQPKVEVAAIETPEINVRGMRVEDAIEEVDRFVDRAIVHGKQQLRIVHGIGTGVLMKALRQHLSEAGYIKEIRRDEKNSGITIVELP